MRIKLKYIGIIDIELPESVELPDGSTIEVLMDVFGNDRMELHNATFLLNREPADVKKVLCDGDSLLILQVLGGG